MEIHAISVTLNGSDLESILLEFNRKISNDFLSDIVMS